MFSGVFRKNRSFCVRVSSTFSFSVTVVQLLNSHSEHLNLKKHVVQVFLPVHNEHQLCNEEEKERWDVDWRVETDI